MTAKRTARAEKGPRETTPAKASPLFGNRATLVSVLLIVTACFIFFWRVIFLGEILTGGDVLAAAAIFEDYANEQMAAGHLPLWNPYIFSGMPFFDSMSWSAFVYPSYWIKFLLERIPGVHMPRLFFLFIHYQLAGLGTFFYLRSRKVGHGGAVIGGIAFMLSPHLVGLATIGHGGKILATAYIPLVLMAAQKLMESAGRRWIAILGLVGGLQFLARHVQISYYTWLAVLVLVIYYLVSRRRAGETWGPLGSSVGSIAAGGVLSALLAAVLLLPLMSYSGFSTRAAEAGGMGFDSAVMWSLHPYELMTFLVPSFFGLANETYWGTMPFQQVSHYVGYVVLSLAAVALIRRRDRSVGFLLVLVAVGIFMAFGRHLGPVYRVIYQVLPGFRRFRVPALSLILAQFSLATLAGYGASILLGEMGQRKESMVRWAAGCAAVGGAVALVVLGARGALGSAATTALLVKHVGAQVAQLRGLGATAATLAFKDAGILLAFAAASGVAIFVAGTRRLQRPLVFALLLGLVVWDVGLVNARFMRPEKMRPLDSYYPESPAVSFLKQQEGVFRIAPVDREFSSNAWMYHRIESIGGYHPAKLAVTDDVLNKLSVSNLKLLALLNVKYVVGPEELKHPAFVRVGPGVHENLTVLPRVFLVGAAKRVSSGSMVLAELRVDNFNPAQTAIVTEELPGPVVGAEGSVAELVSYEPGEIRVRASIRQPCLLVFSEVYYPPGWKASVDGAETTIYRTDYALRSVYLTPGEHTVVMSYVPSQLRLGLFISLLALAALVGLLVWPARAQDGGAPA
ncbi:MAG: YfhO family protein [Candidatus Eisenbacteria bacterium]